MGSFLGKSRNSFGGKGFCFGDGVSKEEFKYFVIFEFFF